jgi:hypothetical protein
MTSHNKKRRSLLLAGAAALAALPLPFARAQGPAASAGSVKGMQLVLLGTNGGPRIDGSRSNCANPLFIDGVP